MHLVNAARLCIPWYYTHMPSIQEWFAQINKIEEMEELIYTSQDWLQKCMTIWSCWSHLKTTEEYRNYLSRSLNCATRTFMSMPHVLGQIV